MPSAIVYASAIVSTITSSIFFHLGDFVPAYEFTHYPCPIEPVYIAGLDETKTYLKADRLYLYEDRVVYHLHPRVTTFEIYSNHSQELLGKIHIRWKTDCDIVAQQATTTTVTTTTTPTLSSNQIASSKQKNTDTKETISVSSTVTSNPPSLTTHLNQGNSLTSLQIVGIQKQTIIIDEPFDLLQNIYLYDKEGNDISHRLSHSSFENDSIGTFFVEVIGNWQSDEVRSLLEVEVTRSEALENPSYSFHGIIIGIMTLLTGGIIIIWNQIRK